MPLKEAAAWVCLTMFGAAIYFVFDWWGEDRVVAAFVIGAIALVGLGYLVYQHHHPEAKLPSTGMWVWLPLVLTWCFLGYAIYVDRTIPKSVPSPAMELPALIGGTEMGARKDKTDHFFFVDTTVIGLAAANNYSKEYSLFVFLLVGDSKIDPGADPAIDRSKPFDLAQRKVEIEVPLGNENTQRILKQGGIDIYLLMIPKNVDQSAYLTFDDLYAHGARQLGHTAMGSSPRALLNMLNGAS